MNKNIFIYICFFLSSVSAFSQLQPSVNNFYDVGILTGPHSKLKTGKNNLYIVFSGRFQDMNVLFFVDPDEINGYNYFVAVGGLLERNYCFFIAESNLKIIDYRLPDFHSTHIGFAVFDDSIPFKDYPDQSVIDRIHIGYIFTNDDNLLEIGLLRNFFSNIRDPIFVQLDKLVNYMEKKDKAKGVR
jgi:hypothetical protein